MMLVVWSVAVLASLAWLVLGVWKSSRGWAVATLLLGPLGAVVPAVRERHHPDTRVTVPWLVHTAFVLLWVLSALTLREQTAREAAAREAAALAEAQAPAPVPADDDGVPLDPVDRFSLQLREAGLSHTLTPLPPRDVPRGATRALRLGVAAPAGDGRELTGVVLQCADARACKRLAGTTKAAGRRSAGGAQVTQNGMLLLALNADPQLEGLHHVVQGVFRRTNLATT